jgi:DNA-directed RNA polymerase subunit RPC12/RpoP
MQEYEQVTCPDCGEKVFVPVPERALGSNAVNAPHWIKRLETKTGQVISTVKGCEHERAKASR